MLCCVTARVELGRSRERRSTNVAWERALASRGFDMARSCFRSPCHSSDQTRAGGWRPRFRAVKRSPSISRRSTSENGLPPTRVLLRALGARCYVARTGSPRRISPRLRRHRRLGKFFQHSNRGYQCGRACSGNPAAACWNGNAGIRSGRCPDRELVECRYPRGGRGWRRGRGRWRECSRRRRPARIGARQAAAKENEGGARGEAGGGAMLPGAPQGEKALGRREALRISRRRRRGRLRGRLRFVSCGEVDAKRDEHWWRLCRGQCRRRRVWYGAAGALRGIMLRMMHPVGSPDFWRNCVVKETRVLRLGGRHP